MGKGRKCNYRCHNEKGTRCRCWCEGQFHGTQGVSARAALKLGSWAMPPQFAEGKTAYIEQKELQLEVASV